MPYFLKGNCVHKGTKEEPGELVKCHEDHAAAVAHMKALYANVDEDSEKLFVDVNGKWYEFVRDKGGEGSGWHKPPRGSHTAENAPNFAGGPGADRTYGTEEEEAPEGSKLCKCVKCNSTFTLPKGKQCKDVECPGCGGRAEQTSPRKDEPAEGREGRTGGGKKEAGQETHECTCSECDKSVYVPLGQRCNEVPCPGCKTKMRSGEEKAAVGAPGPTVHGEGGSLSEGTAMGDESGCKCPHCGKSLPCTAKACPHCKEKIDKVERMESDKRELSSGARSNLPDSAFLYVESGEKDEGGRTTPRSKRHLPYKNAKGEVDLPHLRNAISRLGQPATGKGWMTPELRERLLSKAQGILKKHGGGEKGITVYKSAAGDWRWLSISNWAVVDREAEVVTEQAYRDAIAHAQKSDQWGELDLVHVNGTDVGDCDMMFVLKSGDEPAKLGAGGTWHDTAKAIRAREVIQAEPSAWGMSVKFRFNPSRKVRGVYTGDIQVLKHTVLPQGMAASYGTAIAVQGGESMSKVLDEKTADALRQLGHTEDEIAELAEKNKAAPQEENVVEKEEATDAGAQPSIESRTQKEQGLIDKIRAMLKMNKPEAPVASEPEGAESDKEVAPAETEEVKAEEPGAEEIDADALKAMGVAVATSIGEATKAEFEKRDAQIAELQAQLKALGGSIEEKVEARLRDVPPVVKVAASQVDATATTETAPVGGGKYADLMKSITQATQDTMGQTKYQA